MSATTEVAFRVRLYGGTCQVFPNTAAALDWVDANLPDHAAWWGGAMIAHDRHLDDILSAIERDGLSWDRDGRL